mgnify:CR=1 FL=1
MRKNDEQKTNKLKKEKVKKEKTKKIPKRDNASRKEKKIKMKESSGGQKKEKSEIPFYRSIAMRLVGAFLIPVIGVLVLGITSYNNASNAIVDTYKESVQQTADTMQQYINLVITSEKDEFKTYLTESDLRKYFAGLMDMYDESSVRKDYQGRLRNKMALDSKIQGAYIIADNKRTIVRELFVTEMFIRTMSDAIRENWSAKVQQTGFSSGQMKVRIKHWIWELIPTVCELPKK